MLKGDEVALTVESAWNKGTNIGECLRQAPVETRAYVLAQVARLVKMYDAKKTLQDDDEILFCVQSIFSECTTLKLEELPLIFDLILKGAFGKMFERLKTQEILGCIYTYEGTYRAVMREKQIHNAKFEDDVPRKLEPLNLARLVKDSPKPKGQGIGTRLKQDLDSYAEYDESLLDSYNDKEETKGET